MPDRTWVIAQFAIAAVLLVLSAIGVIGSLFFDAAELTFSFQGAIQAYAIFPGLVLSLIVNALVMRRHRERGLSAAEKILLAIEFGLIALLVLFHFYTDSAGTTFGLAILVWPVVIGIAIAVAIVAVYRNAVRPATPQPAAPPAPQAPPRPPAG